MSTVVFPVYALLVSYSMATMTAHMQFVRKLVTVLDTKFTFFGIRFGIDPLFDFIPGAGNIIAAVTSCYLFWIARELRVPNVVYMRMLGNIVVDFLVGVVPVIGIVFDVLYKSNVRNLILLEPYNNFSIETGKLVDD